ncbi:hypothetical protein [Streptomyces melanogenes]|uniref:hypothetical protein n=1 Tax=Streptomyces melanogenes TaxID=67326 RepID=UPI00167CF4C0|nr:hypothetical protein [Streptomyces melanogenes]
MQKPTRARVAAVLAAPVLSLTLLAPAASAVTAAESNPPAAEQTHRVHKPLLHDQETYRPLVHGTLNHKRAIEEAPTPPVPDPGSAPATLPTGDLGGLLGGLLGDDGLVGGLLKGLLGPNGAVAGLLKGLTGGGLGDTTGKLPVG